MQTVFFPSGNETIAGNLLLADDIHAPGVLVLHGGGNGNKERFMDLQLALLKEQISSLAIDFRGVGQSTGEFQDGSLKNRIDDAKAALKELKKYTNRLGVFGSSMGGFVACFLANDPDVHIVALASAAAYSPESEDKPLNEEFTKAITIPESWSSSRSFIELSLLHGTVLVTYGEFDRTIPQGVKERYKAIAEKQGKYLVFSGAEHSFMAPKTESGKEARPIILETISRFIKDHI